MSLLRPPMERVLLMVAAVLDSASIQYELGGSAMLRLRGADVDVGDLDVVVDPAARERFESACGHWNPVISPGGPEPWHSVWLARMVIDGVAVDAIGGLAVRIGGRVTSIPLDSDEAVMVGVANVSLSRLEAWAAIYEAIGSPRHAEAIALLTNR